MTAAHPTLWPSRPGVVRLGDGRTRVWPWGTAPSSWVILAAVVVGVAFGAMACAAGLAEGSGHRVHAQARDTGVTPATRSHDAHVAAEPGAAGEGAHLAPVAPGNDTRSGPDGGWIDGHPGMACVMTVDLDVDDIVTPVMAGRFDTAREMLPVDCVVDLDPPVPRPS